VCVCVCLFLSLSLNRALSLLLYWAEDRPEVIRLVNVLAEALAMLVFVEPYVAAAALGVG
jgi:hypothetical protein